MAKLLEKISQDLVDAQKSRDEVTVSTLRLLIADVKNAQIAKGGELSDDEVLDQIQKSAKKRRESIDAYQKAQRDDLVSKEKAEFEVLAKYLPQQMSEEEIAKIVDEVVGKVGASTASDMGRVMGEVMAKVKGKADGNIVSQIVKSKLSS